MITEIATRYRRSTSIPVQRSDKSFHRSRHRIVIGGTTVIERAGADYQASPWRAIGSPRKGPRRRAKKRHPRSRTEVLHLTPTRPSSAVNVQSGRGAVIAQLLGDHFCRSRRAYHRRRVGTQGGAPSRGNGGSEPASARRPKARNPSRLRSDRRGRHEHVGASTARCRCPGLSTAQKPSVSRPS